MKGPVIGLIILACAALLPATPSEAASFRCGIHLIQGGGRHGPTMYEVLKKCGEPKERRARTWIYRHSGSNWELNFNGNGLLLTVRQQR